jgi:hypothetical protein
LRFPANVSTSDSASIGQTSLISSPNSNFIQVQSPDEFQILVYFEIPFSSLSSH